MKTTPPEILEAIDLLHRSLGAFVGRTDQDAVWEMRMIQTQVEQMIEEAIRSVEEDVA